ncbi:MAG: hypothetical protein WBP81_00425, partial [Solirubrobacteraceae bacterium]
MGVDTFFRIRRSGGRLLDRRHPHNRSDRKDHQQPIAGRDGKRNKSENLDCNLPIESTILESSAARCDRSTVGLRDPDPGFPAIPRTANSGRKLRTIACGRVLECALASAR